MCFNLTILGHLLKEITNQKAYKLEMFLTHVLEILGLLLLCFIVIMPKMKKSCCLCRQEIKSGLCDNKNVILRRSTSFNKYTVTHYKSAVDNQDN